MVRKEKSLGGKQNTEDIRLKLCLKIVSNVAESDCELNNGVRLQTRDWISHGDLKQTKRSESRTRRGSNETTSVGRKKEPKGSRMADRLNIPNVDQVSGANWSKS